MTNQSRVSFGSFLPLKSRRKVLLIFSRDESRWFNRIQRGYNHVAMAEVFGEFLVIVEPLFRGATIMYRTLPTQYEWDGYAVLELDIIPSRGNKLIRPLIQTCATFCQYLCGFDLHTIWVQTLYERLTRGCSTWNLEEFGIRRVTQWGQKPQ